MDGPLEKGVFYHFHFLTLVQYQYAVYLAKIFVNTTHVTSTQYYAESWTTASGQKCLFATLRYVA